MSDSNTSARRGSDGGDFQATVWPSSFPGDSESQRRKKFAVRSGHLALMLLVVASVAGTLVANYSHLTWQKLAWFTGVGLVYILWCLHGTRGAVRMLLWERGTPPAPSSLVPWPGAASYFAVQLGLAALVYFLGHQGRTPAPLWLALLPPVAYAVILLERPGVVLISLATLAIFAGNVIRWQGWTHVPSEVLAFSFAVLFTLVFTLLAVNSEKARAEVQRLAVELGEANCKLREYAVQAEELASIRERNRLAREIHDTLGHYLTVVHVQLEAARALRIRDPDHAQSALDKAQLLTQEGLQEIRRSVAALRAAPLDSRPLAEALKQAADETQASGLATEVELLGEVRALSAPTELTLFRAGQEGLTNVHKHARATRVRLVLDFLAPSQVRLSVCDDGVGAAPGADTAGGFGLLGLRERAQLLGGVVRVRTAPGAGFTLEVEVPG